MAIQFPRNFPDIPIVSSRIGLNVNQAVFEAGLSRKVTVQNHAAGLTDRWEGVFTTAELSKNQMAEMSAWVLSLKGREKNFYAFDPDRKLPQGNATSQSSTPIVLGAGQIGNSLLSSGWLPSQNGLLLAGDYIQIGAGFHMLLENVNSDASGQSVLNFEPVLRVSPTNTAPIIFEKPIIIARLSTMVEGWTTGKNKTGTISFSWEEVL